MAQVPEKGIRHMGFMLLIIVVLIIIKSFYEPNTSSTSYRVGKGCGNKTRQFGKWLTKDD